MDYCHNHQVKCFRNLNKKIYMEPQEQRCVHCFHRLSQHAKYRRQTKRSFPNWWCPRLDWIIKILLWPLLGWLLSEEKFESIITTQRTISGSQKHIQEKGYMYTETNANSKNMHAHLTKWSKRTHGSIQLLWYRSLIIIAFCIWKRKESENIELSKQSYDICICF